MKYQLDILIDRPINEIVKLFQDPENMKQWQQGLISFTPVSGVPGHPGAVSMLKYKMGSRVTEMTETIKVNNLPAEYSATYEARGVWNLQRNQFKIADNNKTRWVTISEFKCSGFMKFFCWLMPGTFKRQTFKYMKRFKEFAENNPKTNNTQEEA